MGFEHKKSHRRWQHRWQIVNIKIYYEVYFIMKNQLLKTISELSPNAAYWMGKRDGYKSQILGLLQQITVADLA